MPKLCPECGGLIKKVAADFNILIPTCQICGEQFLSLQIMEEMQKKMDSLLTDEELNIIKHATGFYSDIPFYRNVFCASPKGTDDRIWLGLIKKGYARLLRHNNKDLYPYNVYKVNERGIEYLKSIMEKL